MVNVRSRSWRSSMLPWTVCVAPLLSVYVSLAIVPVPFLLSRPDGYILLPIPIQRYGYYVSLRISFPNVLRWVGGGANCLGACSLAAWPLRCLVAWSERLRAAPDPSRTLARRRTSVLLKFHKRGCWETAQMFWLAVWAGQRRNRRAAVRNKRAGRK